MEFEYADRRIGLNFGKKESSGNHYLATLDGKLMAIQAFRRFGTNGKTRI